MCPVKCVIDHLLVSQELSTGLQCAGDSPSDMSNGGFHHPSFLLLCLQRWDQARNLLALRIQFLAWLGMSHRSWEHLKNSKEGSHGQSIKNTAASGGKVVERQC